tara:strand:- start:203 stop:1264 length:1062 start_codon:yes stop_codon:yes gene_type:complete
MVKRNPNRKGINSNKSSSNTGGKNKGPKHGHGNKGKSGGGNAYGSNNINMTISQAKKIYANQLAAGYSLQEAMKHNKAETVSYWDLLDEKNDTKKTNSTNNMALTANQTKLNELYQKNFGRDASFGTKGGADYWLDTHGQGDNVDWNKIDAMLGGSDEGQKHAGNVSGYNKGQVYVGGIDSTKSIASQSGWADHFKDGGTFANQNAAGAAQAIADNIGFTPQEAYFNNSVGGGGDDNNNNNDDATVGGAPDGWWNQFDDADAFKDFLKGDSSDNGMGDFMKFMMLMSVMGGGQGMGGGGYGGSSYGYGGLTPGGVMQANDPWSKMKDGFSWFKDSFGSGGTTDDNTVGLLNTN